MPDPKEGEPGYVDPALKKKDDEPKPGEPGYVEPKKEPPEGLPGEEPPEPKKEPLKADDPLAQKLEGDKVPEKYRGKTVEEILALTGVTETELMTAKKEIGQWHQYAEAEEAKLAGEKKKEEYDPLEHMDEDTARAVSVLIANQTKPLTDAMDGMALDKVRQTRPDFSEFEERALKVYREMPFQHKYHPAYGLDFAYRFAKAEKEGGPPPPGPAPPAMGPSNTGGDPGAKEGALTKAELYIAEKMGMTPEEYTKHKTETSPTVEMEASGKPKE